MTKRVIEMKKMTISQTSLKKTTPFLDESFPFFNGFRDFKVLKRGLAKVLLDLSPLTSFDGLYLFEFNPMVHSVPTHSKFLYNGSFYH